MPPTFLWVLKFDVKLGVWLKIFKFTAGRWLFFFEVPKVSLFTGGFLPFWKPADVLFDGTGKIFKFIAGRWLFYFRFQKFHFFTKDFKKNFEFDVKSPFFWFFSEFSRKVHFLGGGKHKIWVLVGGFNLIFFCEFSDNLMGRVEWVDGPEKCPLNFFILLCI